MQPTSQLPNWCWTVPGGALLSDFLHKLLEHDRVINEIASVKSRCLFNGGVHSKAADDAAYSLPSVCSWSQAVPAPPSAPPRHPTPSSQLQ